MKWPRWSIATGDSGDFLPLLFGGIFLLVSLPAFSTGIAPLSNNPWPNILAMRHHRGDIFS
jgi:hypothetical protein